MNNEGTPIVSPFAQLLRNRQFVAAIVGSLIALLIQVIPVFEPARETLTETVLLLFGLAIGGFSVEGAAAAHGEAQVRAAFVQNATSSGVNRNIAQNARQAYDAFNAKTPSTATTPYTTTER